MGGRLRAALRYNKVTNLQVALRALSVPVPQYGGTMRMAFDHVNTYIFDPKLLPGNIGLVWPVIGRYFCPDAYRWLGRGFIIHFFRIESQGLNGGPAEDHVTPGLSLFFFALREVKKCSLPASFLIFMPDLYRKYSPHRFLQGLLTMRTVHS